MASDETVTMRELVLANNIELDALVKVLVAKGVITETELLDAIRHGDEGIAHAGRTSAHPAIVERGRCCDAAREEKSDEGF